MLTKEISKLPAIRLSFIEPMYAQAGRDLPSVSLHETPLGYADSKNSGVNDYKMSLREFARKAPDDVGTDSG